LLARGAGAGGGQVGSSQRPGATGQSVRP
jgi:hypothetical protein